MKKTKSSILKAAFVTALVFALAAYFGMFTRLAAIFANEQEDMSHGWLVPLFSAYVVWTDRRELARLIARGVPAWGGVFALVWALIMLFFGFRGLQVRLEVVSFILFVVALPWALWGREVARRLLFPAGYLVFMIPLATYLDFITIHLRLFASGAAMAVMNGIGISAARVGTVITSNDGPVRFAIDVAEPCSGMRSLFALMALTAAYARFAQPTRIRRLALFACSIPLAVLGNVTRIVSICLVAGFAGREFALGYYHDYSGYVVFAVAIALMLLVSDVITRLARRFAKKGGETPAARAERPEAPEPVFAPVAFAPAAAAVAAVVVATVVQLAAPAPAIAEPPVVRIPERLPGYAAGPIRYCHSESCGRVTVTLKPGEPVPERCPACGGELFEQSLGEKTVLPADTRTLKRAYLAADGSAYTVTAVIGGASKSSIHRPELCLPAQGFAMMAPRYVEAAGVPFRLIPLVAPGSSGRGALAYTFFNQEGFRTASHLERILRDVWDRTVLNRVDRWVMLTVSAMPSAVPGRLPPDEALERMLFDYMRGGVAAWKR